VTVKGIASHAAATTLFARSKNPSIELMAKIGYAARGIVFMLIGLFAVLAAIGSRKHVVGNKGALVAVLAEPFGNVMLAVIAAGLLCFGTWRGLQAVADADHLGRDARALARRTAYAGVALFYFALAAWAVGLAFGWHKRTRNEEQPVHDWTAWLLSMPFGQWIMAIIGVAVVGTALGIASKAISAKYDEKLKAAMRTRRWIVAVGRIGNLARAAVFLLIGGFLINAAVTANSRQAKGLAGALQSLEALPYGWVLLGLGAIGLVAFGIYELILVGYRKVDVPNDRS
jgi:hypothetical protein